MKKLEDKQDLEGIRNYVFQKTLKKKRRHFVQRKPRGSMVILFINLEIILIFHIFCGTKERATLVEIGVCSLYKCTFKSAPENRGHFPCHH